MADTLITNLANIASPTGAEEVPVNVPGSPDTDGKVVLSALAAYVEGTLGLGGAAGLDVGTTAGTVAAGDDARFTDARTPTAHAASHVNGTDDIQDATASQKGLATAAQITKLDGIENAADVTDAANVGSSIHGAAEKTTPVDADTVPLIDSAASNVIKKLTWANIKATLKTYFDTLYKAAGAEALRIPIFFSDQSTDWTTGLKVTFTWRFGATTLSSTPIDCVTAPTGSAAQFDVKKNGATIYGTKPTIDAGETTTDTAATPAVISTTSLANGDIITIHIDQIGSSNKGQGGVITFVGTTIP